MSLKDMQRTAVRAGLLGAVWCLIPASAYAYIDPNATNAIFQIFGPLIAMITTAGLLAWEKVKSVVARATSWLSRIWR